MQILNSKIYGEGDEHLIIVHGLFGSLDNWNTLGKKYATQFTTHLVDLRNHGRSFHNAETSHESMANDLINYLEHHNISRAYFMGHSLGGKVVMMLALTQPEKVERMISADMAPKAYPPHHQGIIKGLKNVDFTQVKLRGDAEDFLTPYIPALGVRQFLMKNIYRTNDGKYAFRFNLEALSTNYKELVGSNLPKKTFSKPTLFLGGENSDYILREDLPLIHNYFPNAVLDYVSNASHWLHAENPSEFMDKTMKFLTE